MAVAAGILLDKGLLLGGEATSRSESAHLHVTARVNGEAVVAEIAELEAEVARLRGAP